MNKYAEILNPIAELIQRKNTDYGDSFSQLRKKYGPVGFHIRIADKLNRIEQLDKSEALVNGEAVEDTISDIIGYCTLELQYRMEEKDRLVQVPACTESDDKDVLRRLKDMGM